MQSTNLASTNWVTVSNAVPIDGAIVMTTSPLHAQFFRLANFELISPAPLLNFLYGYQSVIYWSGSNTSYVVQTTTCLASTSWMTVSNTAPIVGLTVTNSVPAQFFRLAAP